MSMYITTLHHHHISNSSNIAPLPFLIFSLILNPHLFRMRSLRRSRDGAQKLLKGLQTVLEHSGEEWETKSAYGSSQPTILYYPYQSDSSITINLYFSAHPKTIPLLLG